MQKDKLEKFEKTGEAGGEDGLTKGNGWRETGICCPPSPRHHRCHQQLPSVHGSCMCGDKTEDGTQMV